MNLTNHTFVPSIRIFRIQDNTINSTQVIIIVSVSGFLTLLFCYIIYIINDRRKRDEDFRKWLSKEANARIPNIQTQFYKV